MSREIDRKNMSKEDARYLSDRGLLSAEEEEKYGIKVVPNGGTAPDLADVENTGDVGTASADPIVGGTGLPNPPGSNASGAPAPEATGDGDASVEITAESPKPVLVAEAEARNLSTSGNRQEIFDRIVAHDAEQGS